MPKAWLSITCVLLFVGGASHKHGETYFRNIFNTCNILQELDVLDVFEMLEKYFLKDMPWVSCHLKSLANF